MGLVAFSSQEVGPVHWVSQSPQYSSVVGSTHPPSQSISPSFGQVHTPASQVWSELQLTPQAPQLPVLVWVSTQLSPHGVSVAFGHAQAPA